jgi:hypothetical protein
MAQLTALIVLPRYLAEYLQKAIEVCLLPGVAVAKAKGVFLIVYVPLVPVFHLSTSALSVILSR